MYGCHLRQLQLLVGLHIGVIRPVRADYGRQFIILLEYSVFFHVTSTFITEHAGKLYHLFWSKLVQKVQIVFKNGFWGRLLKFSLALRAKSLFVCFRVESAASNDFRRGHDVFIA